jgi:hypothetical protein
LRTPAADTSTDRVSRRPYPPARVILAESDCRVLELTTLDSDEYVHSALRTGTSGTSPRRSEPAAPLTLLL